MTFAWFAIGWLVLSFVVSVGWGMLARFPASVVDERPVEPEVVRYRIRVPASPLRHGEPALTSSRHAV